MGHYHQHNGAPRSESSERAEALLLYAPTRSGTFYHQSNPTEILIGFHKDTRYRSARIIPKLDRVCLSLEDCAQMYDDIGHTCLAQNTMIDDLEFALRHLTAYAYMRMCMQAEGDNTLLFDVRCVLSQTAGERERSIREMQ